MGDDESGIADPLLSEALSDDGTYSSARSLSGEGTGDGTADTHCR